MLLLVHNALELWMVPCNLGNCLQARRGKAAPRRDSGGKGLALALKLRMIQSAHARPGQRLPQRCGKNCLGLLQKDLLKLIPADPLEEEQQAQQAEVAAAVLCFHLLRLNDWLQQPSIRKPESMGLLFRLRGWQRAWNFFQVLWHATVLLPWPWLLDSSWPLFTLLRNVKAEWPKGNTTCGSTAALSSAAQHMDEVLDRGEGFAVPDLSQDYECGWVEALTRRLLVARSIYKYNSWAYRAWNPKTRYFELLPQVEGFSSVLEGLRLDAVKITFKGGALPQLLQSKWDFCDVLASLENVYLFRSLSLQKDVLPPAPVIVEGGANDGIHVAQFLDHWPQAKVLAFEADRTCFAHLVRNLGQRIAQRTTRSRLYGVALAGEMGHRQLYMRAGNHTTSAVNMLFEPVDEYGDIYSHVTFRKETQTVFSVTLDSLRKEGVDTVDFIELDIQCAEFEVLKSSTDILPTATMLLLESCLPPGMCKDAPLWPELHAMLQKKGFMMLVAANDPLEGPDMCFDAIYVNLLLEPTAALAALEVAFNLDAE